MAPAKTWKPAAIVAAAIFALLATIPAWSGQIASSLPQRPPSQTEIASPGVQNRIRSILAAGKLTELRWPDFSRYRASVAEFYRSNDYCLAWISDSRPTPQAIVMIRALENANAKGLNPADYDGPRWVKRIAALEAPNQPTESQLAQFDVALTISSMRYVSDLHFGRIDPSALYSGLDIERHKFNLARFLARRIIDADVPSIRSALEEIEPQFPIYRRALKALRQYQKLASEYPHQRLPVPRKTVDPGDSYSALPQLVRLLYLLGDLPQEADITSTDTIYQGQLVDAIKHFQTRHGLDPDGRIGPRTFLALNTPLAHRVVQLRLLLERIRWLPHTFERPPIIVNIPQFRLHVLNGKLGQVFSMKVVVGRAYGHQTPIFASEIQSVIFRPYWNVPFSIQQNELVPHIRKDPNYLKKHNYEVVDSRGRVVSEGQVDASMIKGLATGRLFARQRPGPDNSLGLIKFQLPNAYEIYLHGTPATMLFSRSRRDFSHGCIRVEDPVALAAWVLRDNPDWTPAKIREAMNGQETFEVKLTRPVPVFIMYGTAVVSGNGEISFFRDVYGLDAKLERVLASRHP